MGRHRLPLPRSTATVSAVPIAGSFKNTVTRVANDKCGAAHSLERRSFHRPRSNAGAQKLGVKLPAWIARHGSKRSAAAVINTFTRFRIILTNTVKYVTNVESYDRRIQSAINIHGRKMQRRAEFLPTRALRRAGWK